MIYLISCSSDGLYSSQWIGIWLVDKTIINNRICVTDSWHFYAPPELMKWVMEFLSLSERKLSPQRLKYTQAPQRQWMWVLHVLRPFQAQLLSHKDFTTTTTKSHFITCFHTNILLPRKTNLILNIFSNTCPFWLIGFFFLNLREKRN